MAAWVRAGTGVQFSSSNNPQQQKGRPKGGLPVFRNRLFADQRE
jgi:hypothetical protein